MIRRGRKFYLDKDNAKIWGVCAGMADYFGWDVTLVRIGWVLTTIFGGGWPIVAYILAAWLVDPKPRVLTYIDHGRDNGRNDPAIPKRARRSTPRAATGSPIARAPGSSRT